MNAIPAEYLAAMESEDEADRIYGAEDVASVGNAEAAEALVSRLGRESSPQVREAIFHGLASIRDEAVIDLAIGLFEDDDPFVRNRAVELLRARNGAALAKLAISMESEDADIRKLTVDVLAGVDGSGAAPLYEKALADADVNVVITAVECIGRARRVEFASRVAELLASSQHPMLEAACVESLSVIGGTAALALVAEKFGPMFENAPAYMLPALLRLYGRTGERSDSLPLASFLLRPEPAVCSAAIDCVLQLMGRNEAPQAAELGSAVARLRESGSTVLVRQQAAQLAGLLEGR